MTTRTNSAEGVTPSGTTVTIGNSGGASGDAFDSVTIAATCTFASDSTQVAHGGLAYKVQYGGTAGNVSGQWNTSMGTLAQVWFRQYLYFTANPGVNTPVWSCAPAAGLCGRLFVTTTGKLVFNDSLGSAILTSTASIPLNAWFRVEGFLIGSATVGQLEFKLFTSMDSATAAETQTSAATVNTNSASITRYDFGDSGTAIATVGPFWVDDLGLSSTGYIGPAAAAGAPVLLQPGGMAWRRRFRRPQMLPQLPSVPPGIGPQAYPLHGPVRARQLPARGGSVTRRAGTYSGTGPPLKAPAAPVQARALPARGGHASARAGIFAQAGPPLKALAAAISARIRVLPPRGRTTGHAGTWAGAGAALKPLSGPVRAVRQPPQPGGRVAGIAHAAAVVVTPTAGPPVYPLQRPVQARRQPLRGGRVTRAAGTFAGTGPAVKAAGGPVRAQPPPPRGGRAASWAGTFTAVSLTSGPPVYPLGHPVTAKRLPLRGGTVSRRAGTFAQAGPPLTPLKQPVGVYRRQPPPPQRGRVLSRGGIRGGTGPPVQPLRRAVRARLPVPVLTGRVHTTLLPPVATPPPLVTFGKSFAGTGAAASAAPGSGGPSAAVGTGVPSGGAYTAAYGPVYAAAGGTASPGSGGPSASPGTGSTGTSAPGSG